MLTPWLPNGTNASPFLSNAVTVIITGSYFCPSALQRATEHPGNAPLPTVSSPLCVLFFATVSRWGPCEHTRLLTSLPSSLQGVSNHKRAAEAKNMTYGFATEDRRAHRIQYRVAKHIFTHSNKRKDKTQQSSLHRSDVYCCTFDTS